LGEVGTPRAPLPYQHQPQTLSEVLGLLAALARNLKPARKSMLSVWNNLENERAYSIQLNASLAFSLILAETI